MNIEFNNQVPYKLSEKRSLRSLFKKIAENEGRTLKQLTFILCSDNFLLDLNRQHLQHDYFTDILTFDLSEHPDEITGEIYISIDRVKENALLYKTNTINELTRIMIHGVLHLCGYRDKTKVQKSRMTMKEDDYLNTLAVSRETKAKRSA